MTEWEQKNAPTLLLIEKDTTLYLLRFPIIPRYRHTNWTIIRIDIM